MLLVIYLESKALFYYYIRNTIFFKTKEPQRQELGALSLRLTLPVSIPLSQAKPDFKKCYRGTDCAYLHLVDSNQCDDKRSPKNNPCNHAGDIHSHIKRPICFGERHSQEKVRPESEKSDHEPRNKTQGRIHLKPPEVE